MHTLSWVGIKDTTRGVIGWRRNTLDYISNLINTKRDNFTSFLEEDSLRLKQRKTSTPQEVTWKSRLTQLTRGIRPTIVER